MTMETLGCSTAGGGGLANKKFGYSNIFKMFQSLLFHQIHCHNIVYTEMLPGYILCRLNHRHILLIKHAYRGESMLNFVDKDQKYKHQEIVIHHNSNVHVVAYSNSHNEDFIRSAHSDYN